MLGEASVNILPSFYLGKYFNNHEEEEEEASAPGMAKAPRRARQGGGREWGKGAAREKRSDLFPGVPLSLAGSSHSRPVSLLPNPKGQPSCFLLLLYESSLASASIFIRPF